MFIIMANAKISSLLIDLFSNSCKTSKFLRYFESKIKCYRVFGKRLSLTKRFNFLLTWNNFNKKNEKTKRIYF